MKIMGIERKRCPRRPVLENPNEFAYWLGLYRNYTKGILPEPGAWLEQSALTVEVFNALDGVYGRIEEHRAAERAKNKGGGARSGPPAGGRLTSRGNG